MLISRLKGQMIDKIQTHQSDIGRVGVGDQESKRILKVKTKILKLDEHTPDVENNILILSDQEKVI